MCEYYDRENPNQHLPENVIAELCTRYQVTPDYLRQIKRRAYEQLKRSLVPPDTGETKGTQL
jgi:predicted SPOUT superfamily RNA methylase MTH1